MPDPISSFLEWLNTPILFGVPTWFFVGVGLLVAIAILYKPKPETFKRKSTTKEIKEEFDKLFKMFGTPVNKRLDSGISSIRFVLSYISIYWDRNLSIKMNLKEGRQLRRFLRKNPDMVDEKGNLKANYEEMYIFRVCPTGVIGKVLAKIGLRVNYMLVPRNLTDISKDIIVIDPKAIPSQIFQTIIYDKSGREYIENVCYKLNRENELDEFVNQIPKQNYLEVNTASRVAKAREEANIEKEKYKGQLEGAT